MENRNMLIIGALAVVLVGLVGFLIFHQMSGANGSDVSHVKLDTGAAPDTSRGTSVPMGGGSANGGGSAPGNSGVHTPHKSSDPR